ncbi:DUF89-domain-containing protein [Apiospora arundinis]|uniref:Sugar phosphate phosphatase n=1 Tax=Apiospora arundinis TaxID=335852 RepID=A0ABR2IBF9_9PEZI
MVMETKTPPYMTNDKTSFAYVSCNDTGKKGEGQTIVEELTRLKYELQHDHQLTSLRDDGEPDIAQYNEELEKLGNPTWFNAPWLYSECYLYRRVNTSFNLSTYWKSYDIFARQKMSTFRSSRPAVLELAARFKELVLQIDKGKNNTSTEYEGAQEALFHEMCEICLWGNATDLSLLTSLTYEDIQKLQGSEARKNSKGNILINNLDIAYELLKKAKDEGKERRVDIVLDNAGFELYVDLILAGYLLSSGLVTHVVLHPKSIPWFVSDVLPKDFTDLLSALANPNLFYDIPSDEKRQDKTPETISDKEAEEMSFLFRQWAGFHAAGQLVLRPDRFWTHAGSFWRLPVEKDLYEDLKASELVIFKGDLNYRKLTGDAAWDPTTPFTEALGPLGPGSGINVLAMRTCKADVVVGLKPGEDEDIRASEGGGGDSGCRKWAWNGKWAVISFSGGEKGGGRVGERRH